MTIIEYLSQPLWQRLALTLVHLLWQGLAIALLIPAFVWLFKVKHGNGRYIFYLAGFLIMIACPVITFTVIDIPFETAPLAILEITEESELTEPVYIESEIPLPAVDLPKADISISYEPKVFPVPLSQRISVYLHSSLPWLLVAWMIGVLILSIRLLIGFIGVYRWRRNRKPLPERLALRVKLLSKRLGLKGFSRVFISPRVIQAMAIGYLRPMVLLPASMITQMTTDMLEAVIAHELAHIRRFDLWINLIQRIAETLLFYHPAIWWLSGCIRSERELCCDELAVKVTGRRLNYAATLERVSRDGILARQPVFASGLCRDKKPLLSRVRHILGLTPIQRNTRFWLAGLITVLFLTALVIPTALALSARANKKTDVQVESEEKQSEYTDKVRVIHFPKDRSMGLVHVGELRTSDPHWWQGWEVVGQAKGDVRVPLNKDVRLDISTEASEDISPLAALGSDDIQAISFNWNRCNIDDSDLKHLAGLTGLKLLALSSTQIKGPGLVHLSGLKSLEALLLSRTEISDDSLEHIARLKSLKRLDLGSTKVTDAGLTHLRNLNSLERINLGSTGISGKGFSSLANTTSIKTLWLNHSDITDEGLKHIAKLKSLERLFLVNTAISDIGIEHISKLKALKELDLSTFGVSKMKLSGAALRHIAKLTFLENLELPGGITDADLVRLEGLTRLKLLDISEVEITGAGLDLLKDFKSLESLRLPQGVTDKELETLKELTSLKEILIQNSPITNKGLINLSHLKSLQRLFLLEGRSGDETWKVTSECLAYLRDLPIKSLHISGIKLSDSRLTSLEELTQLEELEISQMSLYDEDLASLSKFTNLKRLIFDSETVSYGGIAYLADLTSLEDLIPWVPMTDVGLSHLVNLSKLQRLQIKGNITEQGLNHLAKLKALRDLSIISENDFSDASLQQLKSKLPMLQRLNVAKDINIKNPPKTGTLAPQFRVKTIDDKEVTLADYNGKVVLLYFWGTWCSPCVASTPEIKKLYEELSKYDDFVMVSLCIDNDEFRVRRHIEKYKLSWPQVRLGIHSKVVADYGLKGVPAYFLIGPDGRIASVEENQHKLKAVVANMLGTSKDNKPDVKVEGKDKQKNIIHGVVYNEDSKPVADALVLPLPHGGHPVRTGVDGKFKLPSPSEDRRIEMLLVRDINNNLAAAAEFSDFNEPADITLIKGITITGRITDPNGTSIAGAKIHPSVHTEEWTAGFGYTVFQPTDSNGIYEIKALPVGQDYSIGVGGVEGYGGNSVRLGILDRPGLQKTENIILEPANLSITGIVLDDKDNPMAGVNVQASGKIQITKEVKTDSTGRFKIDGICKGRVELYAWTSDHLWGGTDEVKGGDQNIEIFLREGRQTCMLPAKNPPSSLVGKKLPELQELNIELTEDDINGKCILVCFWKLMHDESRDCIRQLAARSEELAKNNIVIVAAQIWPRNEKQLRRWLAKNNVKFPVSILPDPWQQKPEERPTYRWGVQNRVPWLVLTDNQHVVRAEGFSIDDLDEKIRLFETADVKVEGKEPNAVQLVRAVRESENWIHRVDSFYAQIEYDWTKTPQGIAARRAELKEQFPDMEIDPDQHRGLQPKLSGMTELAFDQQRLRRLEFTFDYSYYLKIWNGNQLMVDNKFPKLKQEQYQFDNKPDVIDDVFFAGISWLRTQPYSFWWSPIAVEDQMDYYGHAEDFVLKGLSKYRGIDCYILECKPKDLPGRTRKWYVGVKDKLLYGNLLLNNKGEKVREHWTLDYREIAPKCWFPMTQGHNLYKMDDKGKVFLGGKKEMKVVKTNVNEKLPDELFQIDFKEGVQVVDSRFGGLVSYPYKAERTDKEWKEIRQKAIEKDKIRKEQKLFKDELIGRKAPEFPEKAEWLNSTPLGWDDLRGKVVILDFWAEWCGPCKNELPNMNSLYKRRDETGIEVIGIHTPGSKVGDIQQVMEKYDLRCPIFIDKSPTRGSKGFGIMSSAFGVNAIPYSFVIDQQGNIAGHGWSISEVLGKAYELANKNKEQTSGGQWLEGKMDNIKTKEIYLPAEDISPMALKLSSGELIRIREISDINNFDVDIAYSSDDTGSSKGFVFLRGATADKSLIYIKDQNLRVYEIKGELPEILTVTTLEGYEYKLEILSADEKGCRFKYICINNPAGQDEGGGSGLPNNLLDGSIREYPVLLSWAAVEGAEKYVINVRGIRRSRPAQSFETMANNFTLDKTNTIPGRYQWSATAYNKDGEFISEIETTEPGKVFAIEDDKPVSLNGKKALIDLYHTAGHINGLGYYNHSHYMIKHLLEAAGFETEVNSRDLLTSLRLESVDLVILNYYWTGWPEFRPFVQSELTAMHQFVEQGGSLLVIGCDRNDGGGEMVKVGNQLVDEFGLSFSLDKISQQQILATTAPGQDVINISKDIPIQLPVEVEGESDTTLLTFDGVPIIKSKQVGEGQVIAAGVGMSFLDCYLGNYERREQLHSILFFDLIESLTGIDWKEHCSKEVIEAITSTIQNPAGQDEEK